MLIPFWSCFFIVFKLCFKYSAFLPRCDWLKSQTFWWSRGKEKLNHCWQHAILLKKTSITGIYLIKHIKLSLKLVFYRTFFWWFYIQGLKIYLSKLDMCHINCCPSSFFVFLNWGFGLRNMNLKLKGFWSCTLLLLGSTMEVQKELLTSFLHDSCFETFLKNSQKTPLQ